MWPAPSDAEKKIDSLGIKQSFFDPLIGLHLITNSQQLGWGKAYLSYFVDENSVYSVLNLLLWYVEKSTHMLQAISYRSLNHVSC
jgi:hypothetical protein